MEKEYRPNSQIETLKVHGYDVCTLHYAVWKIYTAKRKELKELKKTGIRSYSVPGLEKDLEEITILKDLLKRRYKEIMLGIKY